MSRWSQLSDDELDRRLADELRSMANEPRLGADWARLDLLPTVRAGLAERTGRPTSHLSPIYGAVGIVGAVAVLAVVVLLMFARPPSTSGPVGTPPSSTVRSGDFTLTITADKARYTSGEPIHVMARLAYDGDGDKVTLSGSGMILAFSARQSDGELAMEGPRTADCAYHELRRDEPIERPFTKSGGWSRDDPNADFYDQWFRDPVLSLPAGQWEVIVTAEFIVGEGCAGEQVSMRASVGLTVGEPAPADPPATPPSTWSGLNTRDFAARLAAGDLRGQMVVVTGEIVRGDVRAGGPCGAPTRNPCFFGELAGTDPQVVVFAAHRPAPEGPGAIEADVDGIDWRWWEFPERPAGNASLVLFVSDSGLVEYVGVRSDEPMGVNSFGVVDPASWSQSEVAVVPGWLTAVGAGVGITGAPPAPGTYIDGLPQRWSGSPAWLLDRPERFDPDGYFPPTDGVQVQNHAYEMFSGVRPTSRITEPVAGLWAIAPRLEGGGCPNSQPPCWRWNLIGRVTYGEPGPAMPVATPDPTPTPQPTSEPAGTPSAVAEFTCDPFYLTLVDHTGAVSSCTATLPTEMSGDEPRASNPDGDLNVLDLAWLLQDPRACGPEPPRTTLTLTRLRRLPMPPAEPGPYLLRLETDYRPGTGCRDVAAWQGVRIRLSQPVDAGGIILEIGGDGGATSTADTDEGSFALTVNANKGAYAADEPIEVEATLRYEGVETSIFASGGEPLIAFSVEQLDGDLEMAGGIAESCNRYVLHRDSPLRQPFTKSVAYGEDDPNADFYRRWYEDPEFTLPPGIWRITADSRFEPGFDCARSELWLSASVVIVVEGAPSGAIPLRTSEPPAPWQRGCNLALGGGLLALHAETGLGVANALGEVWPIVWPFGYTARREGEAALLIDPDGNVVAREGDRVQFGGGLRADGPFGVCGPVEVVEP